MKVYVRFPLALVLLCLLVGSTATQADPILSGYDLLESDSGTTYQDFTLPADFFGPGSDPFDGRVYLKGVPFDCFDPDGLPGPEPTYCGLLPTDTIVRRLADADPNGSPATVPIEIVELALESVMPMAVTFNGGAIVQFWEMRADVHVDPASGAVTPPQTAGSMTIRKEHVNGGTFDSTLPVEPHLTFVRLDGPGLIGPIPSPVPIVLQSSDAPWCHVANPLGFPAGQIVVEVTGLNANFFPSVICANIVPPLEPPVSFSVDGGAFNGLRNGAPLTPLPNPAEGLIVPDPRHPNPNDVYAVGTAPGAQGYASEGEVFQSAGSPLGSPPNRTNVDRMSAALGIGPAPGGPPFMGPFLPNPGGAAPAPIPPGVPGPPGSFGPPPGNTVGVLGLVPDDNLDALSYGRDSGNVLLFSVDPATTGVAGSAVYSQAVTSALAGSAAPFPTNPGGGDPGDEAAGDIFKSVQLLNFGRYGFLHFANGRFLTPAWLFANQLALDELALGLQAPAVNGSAIGSPEDDLDGLELSDTGGLVFGVDLVDNSTNTASPDGIPERPVFFSLDAASSSIGLPLPMPVTPDDLLVTPPGGFAFGIFADGVIDIGLLPGDDIDALAVSDVMTIGALDPGVDEALFSLHPGSTSVIFGPDGIPGNGDEVSAADVFYTSFQAPAGIQPILYASSAVLGLRVTDNLNALDIMPAALYPQPTPPPPTPAPGPVKKLVGEAALLAAHGIRVPEKKPCWHHMHGNMVIEIFALGMMFPVEVRTDDFEPALVESSAPAFDPETARSEIATEIVSMRLVGDSPFGPVLATAGREAGLPRSLGEIRPIEPGIDFPAESFFDVCVRIEVEGLVLETLEEETLRLNAEINAIPPYGDPYVKPDVAPVVLYDEMGVPQGLIHEAYLLSSCESDADCVDEDPCTSDSCDFADGVCDHDPLPDTDGDGVCDVADNCAQYPNPGGQAPLVFGHEIVAASPVEFCWPEPIDALWMQGPLNLVSSYAIDLIQVEHGAVCFFHPDDPPPGEGLYYLVKRDCPAGSWQNSLGLEPERDPALP